MKDSRKQLNKIVTGGLLLTMSSFIVKLLSAVYKVPFQNWTGDIGFYVYQQIYPIYGLAVSFSLTGLPAFVSKVVSEAEDSQTLQRRLQELNTWFMSAGIGIFVLLQVGAGWLAQAMGDPQLTASIQSVSFFFLFLPFLALVRGYFQGEANLAPTSISQVAEQLVRVAVLLMVAFFFTQNTWDVYEMGSFAFHSSWLSAVAGGAVLLFYLNKRGEMKNYLRSLKPRWSLTMGKRLLREGLLFVAVSSLMILMQFVDSFTVFNGLIEAGYPDAVAMTLKGVYDRGQPLIQLGMVVGIGFSMTSLPLLRKWALAKEWGEWAENAASVLKITLLLSSAATVGLIAIMPWMNETLFTDQQGTNILQVLMVSIFLASLIYCAHSILQSINQSNSSIFILIVGFSFKVIMNQLAVRNIGLAGSNIVTVFSLLIICIFMLQLIDKAVWTLVFQNKFILKFIILLAGLYASVWGVLHFLQNIAFFAGRLGSFMLTLIGVLVGIVVFVVGALFLNILEPEELEELPLPHILKRFNRK